MTAQHGLNPCPSAILVPCLSFQRTCGNVQGSILAVRSQKTLVPKSLRNVHSFWGALEEAGYGDQVAVVDHYHGGKGGVSFTYSEFREHIRDTAAGLQHFGLAKGVPDLVAAG